MRSLLDVPTFTFDVRREGFSRHFLMHLPGDLKLRYVRDVVEACSACAAFVPKCEVEAFVGRVEQKGRYVTKTVIKIIGSRQAVSQLAESVERAIRARLLIEPRVVLHR